MTGSSFPVEERVNEYIDQSLSRIHDKMVLASEEYAVTKTNLTLVSGQEEYGIADGLPSDMLKLRKVFLLSGGNRYRLKRFMMGEWDGLQDENADASPGSVNMRYRIIGDHSIWFAPKPTGGQAVELWYVPQYASMKNDTDTVPSYLPNGWEDYVTYFVASVLLDKAKSFEHAARYQGRAQEALARIVESIAERDDAESQRIQDVSGRYGPHCERVA